MKKFICIALSVFVTVFTYGQKKNEIILSYSQVTLPQTAYFVAGIFGVAFTAGHFTFENTRPYGALGLEYDRNVNNWFTYGAVGVVDYISSDSYNVDGDGNKTYKGKFSFGYVSLMPLAKFRWFTNPKFGMYSKIAFGAGIVPGGEEENLQVSFAGQLSPVGMQFGGGNVSGILELGYGMQGIVTLGIKKSF